MQKLYALTEKRSIALTLSENPLGCSPRVVSALESIDSKLSSYPSPNGRLLKDKLANKFKLDGDNLFIANGSEAIINSLPQVFGKNKDEVIIPSLTFPMFAVSAELAGKRVVYAEMAQDLGIDLSNMEMSPMNCLPGNTTLFKKNVSKPSLLRSSFSTGIKMACRSCAQR